MAFVNYKINPFVNYKIYKQRKCKEWWNDIIDKKQERWRQKEMQKKLKSLILQHHNLNKKSYNRQMEHHHLIHENKQNMEKAIHLPQMTFQFQAHWKNHWQQLIRTPNMKPKRNGVIHLRKAPSLKTKQMKGRKQRLLPTTKARTRWPKQSLLK